VHFELVHVGNVVQDGRSMLTAFDWFLWSFHLYIKHSYCTHIHTFKHKCLCKF